MKKSLITKPLGIFGWEHLEAIILAALATEAPMLLVGKHGCAKSFLLERLAQALEMNFRLYNASLINYDDLVGIPIPVNNNTSLEYISNPNSIWDAEVVFIDELNRTKPELQNKLFPIIYDKRIQGQSLNKLIYRWAAMNPPLNDDEDDETNEIEYLGAMPLDPALADRFPFIIEVPSWNDLNEQDKKDMLLDQFQGKHDFPINIHQLIQETKDKLSEIIKCKFEESSNYIVVLMDLLKNSFGYISPRRATMLQETLLAIYAAKIVLEKYDSNEKVSFQDSAFIHIQNTLPNAAIKSIDKTLLISICSEALKISKLGESSAKTLLLIGSPIDKIKYCIKNADSIETDTICDVIPSSLSQISNPKRRAVALMLYLSFRKNRNIHAAVMETLANEVRPVFEVKNYNVPVHLLYKKIADRVDVLMNGVSSEEPYYKYLANTMKSFLPEGYTDESQVDELFTLFIELWKELKL